MMEICLIGGAPKGVGRSHLFEPFTDRIPPKDTQVAIGADPQGRQSRKALLRIGQKNRTEKYFGTKVKLSDDRKAKGEQRPPRPQNRAF